MEKKQPIATDADNENFFQHLAIKYLPYWPFFAVLFLFSLALAFVYLQYTVPVYESSASILIKDEKKGQEDSKMEELLNLFNTKKIVENELEIIRSNYRCSNQNEVVRAYLHGIRLAWNDQTKCLSNQSGYTGSVGPPIYHRSQKGIFYYCAQYKQCRNRRQGLPIE
jgi:hypothetical protein